MKLLVAMLGIALLAGECEPIYNMYGGVNNSRIVDNQQIVEIPDDKGKILCSYPIAKSSSYSKVATLDCEDGEGIFVGDD